MKIIDRMKKDHVLIGMVHCLPLPGTMNYGGSVEQIIEKAIADAKVLKQTGFDAVLVEPTLDYPVGMNRNQLQLATMSAICSAIRQNVDILLGVAFLTADCMDMFSIAKASGADFVRITTFVDTIIFPTGVSYPSAVRAWEVRKQYNMQDIAILADIQVKHGKMMYSDIRLEESARLAEIQGADAVIVTGTETGKETPMDTIIRVSKCVQIPVVVGSGVNKDTITSQMKAANGFIVGSSIKEKGNLMSYVNETLALELVEVRNNAEKNCR